MEMERQGEGGRGERERGRERGREGERERGREREREGVSARKSSRICNSPNYFQQTAWVRLCLGMEYRLTRGLVWAHTPAPSINDYVRE